MLIGKRYMTSEKETFIIQACCPDLLSRLAAILLLLYVMNPICCLRTGDFSGTMTLWSPFCAALKTMVIKNQIYGSLL